MSDLNVIPFIRRALAGRRALPVSRRPPTRRRRPLSPAALGLVLLAVSTLAWAQTSPFLTGATALQSNILAWMTPIAVILVMALGAMAMANRISWGWCVAAIAGIAITFGAPQIVTWVRGMFGV
jgi:type IV secretion system protein VirB2